MNATLSAKRLVCLFASLTLLSPAATLAAFDDRQIQCHEAVAKTGATLVDAALNGLVACHKKRDSGALPEATDCNDIAQTAAGAKVAAAASRVDSAANGACGGLNPATLNYVSCPSPCNSEVSAITTMQHAAACIVCLVKNTTEVMAQSALGSPAAPLANVERKCHGAIGKNQRKLLKTLLKERNHCQSGAEQSGAMNTSSCSGADPRGKLAKLRATVAASILKACDVPGIDLFAVDSCNTAAPALLSSCVLNGTDSLGNAVFKSFYELNAEVVTTTTVTSTTNTTNTTVSTTTTTTIRGCDLTISVTDTETLGALQYEVDYGQAVGEFQGSEFAVGCQSLLPPGAFAQFYDDEPARTLNESIISNAGFTTPRNIARCRFDTTDTGIAAGDFVITILAASAPDFMPADPTLAITTIDCTFD